MSPRCALGVASVLALALLVTGCGEIQRIDVEVRPRQDDFAAEIQPALIEAGCSRGPACHESEGAGALIVLVEDDDDSLLRSYESSTSLIDRDSSADSRLLYYVAEGDPRAEHFPMDCWTTDDCVYRKLLAWIDWDGEGPRPQELDCNVADDPLPCR